MLASALACLVVSLAADGPSVEVSTLTGSTVSGRLTALDARQLTLDQSGQSQAVPADQLLLLRVSNALETAPNPTVTTVVLADGSRIRGDRLMATATQVQVQHPMLGTVSIPRVLIRSIQFVMADPALATAWIQLVARDAKTDRIVIRKGDVLDHLDGVVGTIDETTVKFLLDGEDVPVKRERIFGIIPARKDVKSDGRSVRIELAGDEQLFVSSVGFRDGQWELPWPTKEVLRTNPASVRSVDFSAGKVVYLSTVEPREVEETPYFLIMFPYQRDRSLEGRPLRVGPRSFTRGLAIHSRTRLRYRLGGEYRRFTADAGIDPEIPSADALLKITGDGKTLFEDHFTADTPPKSLDLPVDGVVELEILVDYGRDKLDIGDRVHLGDAKVTK